MLPSFDRENQAMYENLSAVYGSKANLEELRTQLADHLAQVLMGIGALLICVTWPVAAYPLTTVVPWATVLLGIGWGGRELSKRRPVLARHVLVWGLTLALLMAMWWSTEPWLPFLGLILPLIGSIFVAGGAVSTAALVAGLAIWLELTGFRSYPLLELLTALILSAGLAWQIVRTLYTALGWAFIMQQRANALLELARDHRAELSKALKSLDTTNRILRRAQDDLIAARNQAEEARLMKEQFAANISHELRTPLNLILGFSELMHLSPEVYGAVEWPPTLRQDIYQIYRSSRHLLEMINDVLDLSRFERVGFSLTKEPTSIASLVRETAAMVQDLFQSQSVRLAVDVAADLPVLEIDRTRIRQVLLNLLNNAQRFTTVGEVRIEALAVDQEVIVKVSDTGPGIPPDKITHIFDEFYQVDGTLRRHHGGAGLGLAISKRFVEAHGGRIGVESPPEGGSTFYFTLPVPDQYVPLSPLHVGRHVQTLDRRPQRPLLLVDPDPTVSELVERHLDEHPVVQVESSALLSEQIARYHPLAVICNEPPGGECQLPNAESLPVPLIECSLPSQAWAASVLAVEACLIKPITSEQLLREVRKLGDMQRILIVDDDRGFCRLIERMLVASGGGFDIRYAYSGEDGLALMREDRPDVVLLDLNLSDLGGFQVLQQMQEDANLAALRVILLTAASYVEHMLTQRGSQVRISRAKGMNLEETLAYLQALVNVIPARYDKEWTAQLEETGQSHPYSSSV